MRKGVKKLAALIYFSTKVINILVRYLKKSNKDVKVAISTTKGYSDKTIPILVERLIKLHIHPNNIYVFEGGYLETNYYFEKVHFYRVDHNSFDLTALISIVQFSIKSDYWLLLHDTVIILDSFKYLFHGVRMQGEDCLVLRKGESMNIGFYSYDYLLQNTKYLFEFKNTDYSKHGLQNVKSRAVKEEDFLFKKAINKKLIFPELRFFEKRKMVNYFNKKRCEEYYPQLGLKKLKANVNINENFIVEI